MLIRHFVQSQTSNPYDPNPEKGRGRDLKQIKQK